MQRYKYATFMITSNMLYFQSLVTFFCISPSFHAVGIEEEAVPCPTQYHTGATATHTHTHREKQRERERLAQWWKKVRRLVKLLPSKSTQSWKKKLN